MNKILFLPIGFVFAVIFAVMVFYASSTDDVVSIAEQDMVTKYVPSNITKANPNILAGGGSSSWRTTNVSDIADTVLFTITGTVLEVGEPIDWASVENDIIVQALIPVTITVDEVHKGYLDSQTHTFYLMSMIPTQSNEFIKYSNMSADDKLASILRDKNKPYPIFPESGQFEIGEKVLVHTSHNSIPSFYMIDYSYNTETLKDFYVLSLGMYSKYQIIDNMAYYGENPTGIPLDVVINEAQ